MGSLILVLMVATHKDQDKRNEGCCSHPTPSPSSDIDNDENGTNTGAAIGAALKNFPPQNQKKS